MHKYKPKFYAYILKNDDKCDLETKLKRIRGYAQLYDLTYSDIIIENNNEVEINPEIYFQLS